MKQAIRKNKALTKAAREIFGEDIVDCAYVETFYLEETPPCKANQERMHHDLANPKFTLVKHHLSYDRLTFIVRFVNGNSVSFTNSEWASMSKVDLKEDNYIRI